MLARFLIALFLVPMSCSADNCEMVSAAYQVSSTPPEYCGGVDPDVCTMDDCPCGDCCEKKPGVCAKLKDSMPTGCGTGKEYDDSKDATAATSETFEATCCKTESTMKTCDEIGAPCDATDARSSAKDLVETTEADFSAKCCDTKVKCDTHTCPAGKKLIASPAAKECTEVPCRDSDCCDDDPATCRGVDISCGENKTNDPSKYGVAATVADFIEKCCSPLATCAAFKDSKAIAKYYSTAAMKQSAATLLFVAIIGVST